jgi:hypothetical protein
VPAFSGRRMYPGGRRVRPTCEAMHTMIVAAAAGVVHGKDVLEIPVFGDAECDAIRARLETLRGEWIRRDGDGGFWTFGPAAYLDLRRVPTAVLTDYWNAAERHRALVREHFEAEYERVRAALEHALGEPVALAEPLSYPGFHIRFARALPRRRGLNGHFDLQYASVPWERCYASVDDAHFSITAAIVLPSSGGGLVTYDYHVAETVLARGDRALIDREGFARPSHCTNYARGSLYVHSGRYFHEVDHNAHVVEGDERVTLQGHARRCEGVWRLYW